MKPEKRQANSLAWRRLNAPSSARGMKAPHSSKRPTLTGGPFALKRLTAHDSPTPATALRWWHCSGLSLPTALWAVASQRPKLLPAVLCSPHPWGSSLRDLPAAVQNCSRQFCRHATSHFDYTASVRRAKLNQCTTLRLRYARRTGVILR